VACDIPDIDMAFVRRLLRAARGHDAAVPVTPDGRLEPLLAVYREGFLGPAREALDAGKRRVRDAFDACTVNYVPLEDVDWLRNLNTPEEYAAFLAQGAAKNRENR